MFCKKCGNSIPDGASVCGYCGTPTQAGTQNSQNANQGEAAGRQSVYGEPAPSYSGQSAGGNSQYSYSNDQTQYQAQGYGYGAPVNPVDGGAVGFAITSLVLGIVAILIVCCVSIWWLTVLVALLGIIFGAVSSENIWEEREWRSRVSYAVRRRL